MTESLKDVAPLNRSREIGMDDLFDLANPQPTYQALVEQGGFLNPAPELAMVYLREDVQFVLRNHELFTSNIEMGMGNVRPLIPLNVDPPDHSKYRKLLDPLFAPKQMDRQEEDLTNRVNALIDTFIDRGECNFTEEFAEPFPSSVFLGLLGLPEDELATFMDMRDGILHPEKVDADASLDFELRQQIMDQTGQTLYSYFDELIEQRRNDPADDIITMFLEAEVGGDKLSSEEILDIMFLFIIAGLDTVSDSLTCSYAFLATHPEHRRRIVDNPDLITGAVEELLRWESPVPGGAPRVATQDVTLPSGNRIAKDAAVMFSVGAANIDAETFGDPFEVRFDREDNPHVAFGGGVHRCLGSHLARRELRITLREWHRRIPEYQLKPGHEELVYPPGLRHVKDLTLAWS